MKNQTFNWKTFDNLNLFAQSWAPENETKAVVILVHGFGEHSTRYTPYIEYFTKKGIAFVGFDLRGHGKSDGKRGSISAYQTFMKDIDLALDKSQKLFPNVPQFLYGHSMGGNIAFNYLLRRKPKIAGGIITSPWLALAKEPNFILKGAVSFLKNLMPNFAIDSGLEIEYISTVAEEVEKYRNDPLNHGKITFRLFYTIWKSGLYGIHHANELEVPVLMMHGTADKITSPKASAKAAASNKDKITYKTWPGKYHELHNEDIRPEVAQTAISWIEKQL